MAEDQAEIAADAQAGVESPPKTEDAVQSEAKGTASEAPPPAEAGKETAQQTKEVKPAAVEEEEPSKQEEEREGKEEQAGGEKQASDEESYHSPGEEEYKSGSDGGAELLRGRRREASDEEDEEEEEEEEDAASGTEAKEEAAGRGRATPAGIAKGEGAYESDAEGKAEADGDADDEGEDVLDDESEDENTDEGKAEDEEEKQDEDEAKPAPKAEVKKPAEPFVVPTAGPFYMHDDRFGGEEAKRPSKGKKLWDGSAASDERWAHDMFEKLNLANDVPPQRSERGRGRYRGGGRGDSAGYGGGRGGRGRGPRSNGEGGGRTFAPAQSAFNDQLSNPSALLPTPQYNIEVLQEFPPPQANSRTVGNPPGKGKEAASNGRPSSAQVQNERGSQNPRANVSGGQNAPPSWADSIEGGPTGWADQAKEQSALPPSRGRGGGRRGSSEGRGQGRSDTRPRTQQRLAAEPVQAAPTGGSNWAPASREGGQPVSAQSGYSREGGWESGANQVRSAATVGTMTSPRPVEQSSPHQGGGERRQAYLQQAEPRPTLRELEVQTDLGDVASPSPKGGSAKAGPPPGFGGGAQYADYSTQYRAPANANAPGRSSPGLQIANDYVPHSAPQQVLPYGQPPLPSYGLPPYPPHLPYAAYGNSEVTWVPMLNNPQASTLTAPPSVYNPNPYASPYAMTGADAAPYMYSSQAVPPPEYAPAAAKQGPSGGPAISRPPSASTLWKPPVSGGVSDTGAADAYGQRQSKPRRYTEMTFQ